MAYNILKHRRGTTQEWLEINLVPEDGELVIEERSDGSRKCKLGDGKTKFTYLPYLDDAVRSELLAKLDSLTKQTDSKIAATRTTLTDRLVAFEESTAKSFSELADRMTQEIAQSSQQVADKAAANLNTNIEKLKTSINKDIKQLDTKTSSNLATAKAELLAKIEATGESLSGVTKETIDNIVASNNEEHQALDAKIEQTVAEERSKRAAQVSELSSDLKKVSAEVKTTKTALTNTFNTSLQKLDTKFSDSIAEETENREKAVSAIEDSLESLGDKLDAHESKNTATEAEIRKVIADDKRAINSKLTAETAERKAQFDYLASDIEEHKKDTEEDLATIASIVEAIDKAHTDAENLLVSKLETEASDRNAQAKAISKKIDSLATVVTSEVKPAIQAVNTKIDSAVATISAKHSADIAELSGNISEATSSLEEQIDTVEQSTRAYIDKEVSAASDKTDRKLNTVSKNAEKLVTDLAAKHTTDLNDIQASLEASVQASEADLYEKLASFKTGLEEADELLEATIYELEEQSEKAIEAVLKQLTNLKEKTKQLDSVDDSLLSTIHEANQNIANLTKQLTDGIVEVKQKHAADHAKLLVDIENLYGIHETEKTQTLNVLLEYVTRFYIELADLVDDDITILRRVYSIYNTLTSAINALDSKLTSSVDSFKTEMRAELTATTADLTKKLEDDKTFLIESINTVKNSLNENIENLRSTANIKINDNKKAIAALEGTIKDNQNALLNKITEVNDRADDIIKNIDIVSNTFDSEFDMVNARIDDANNRLDTQFTRLSNIIALSQGSTTGDAELKDIRTGYNGVTHASAGDAVRAIGNDLDDLKASLPDYIPSNAVDGLLYEDNLLYLTSDGMPVSDPVEITGGGGGGGGSISTVKVKNNLASNTFTVAKNNPAWIDFTYTSFENEEPTGDGVATFYINNKKIDKLGCTVKHGIAKRIDIAEYLKNDSNIVKITCADQYGTARSLVYNISVVDLRVESSFDSARTFNDEITFRYKVFGKIEKTVHVLLDGVEILNSVLSASASGNESTLLIPKQAHGCHKILVYVSALVNGADVQSNILEFEVLCIESSKSESMLASVFTQKEATQGDLLSIPFLLYDPALIEADVDLIISSQVAGQLVEISRSTVTATRELQSWKTRQYPVGHTVFTISYTYNLHGVEKTITKSYSITVTPLQIDINAETDSLQLFLTAQGRSNNEQNPGTWTFNSANAKEPEVTTVFENFNWTSNGWVVDDTGDTCLRLNGDARATINFKPFATDFKEKGKTIEFEFLVRDVNSRDTVVIDCFDGTCGLQATPDTAFLQSSGTRVSCRYKDEERVRVAISVEYADSISRFVSIYLDGILSGIQSYASTDNFSQNNALNITLGSSLCGIDIYSIRVYDKALSTSQVLTNYIADMAEPSTKLKLMTDNDILNDDSRISYDRIKALGQVPIITFTGQMPKSKGDKQVVMMDFENPLDPARSFINVYGGAIPVEIDVQGTSSQFYARKNWKIKLKKKDKTTGKTIFNHEPYQHMKDQVPAQVFCIKVDYAEATGTHNTGSANYVETLYDKTATRNAEGAVTDFIGAGWLPPQKDDERVRTTVAGFPCVIFEKETEDSEPVFSSKGNFNFDKDAEDAFGFSEDYKDFGVECWEFCNNTSNAVNFTGPIPDAWEDDFEPRYVPESANYDRIEELLEVKELAANNKATMTDLQREELATLQASCIANFKQMHDWVLSTATFDTIPDPNNENKTIRVPVSEEEARARLDKFKREFTQHFNMHYCCIYYVFTLFALMTDQRAKNMFLTRWKEEDGVYRWYPYFYDNDTIFGINNEGALVFDYYHEDIDQLGSSNVYNGQNSVLWNNFRECFPIEIQETYYALRSGKKLTYDAIMNYYVTLGSDKWSAAIYNEDAEYKYVTMARPQGSNNTVDASNLYQVRGPGEHHLRYFIANRINYCDSKWYAGSYPNNYFFLRIYTPKPADIPVDATPEKRQEIEELNAKIAASLEAVPANPNITVTAFSNMYSGVRYKSGILQQQRIAAGDECTFTPIDPNETFGDTETAIYGASELSSLGDLSGLYCGVVNLVGDDDASTVDQAKENKLTELIIGNADPRYYNDNFREIVVGTCRLLRTIDLRNCFGLGIAGNNPQKTLDLSGCPNIEHVYTEGTNLTSVNLPAGGYIKTLHLPATINTLVIKDQQYIDDFSIESYDNIRTLCLEDCPKLNAKAILEECKDAEGNFTVERVRLTGINWTFDDPSFIQSLFPRFDDEGNIIGGIRGIDDKNNPLDDAYLVGSCYIEELTGAEYAEIKAHYPYLNIGFGKMTSNVIFKYEDVNGVEYTKQVSLLNENSTFSTCPEPNLDPIPAWPVNDAFTYERVGWSREKQISNGLEDHEDDYLEYIHLDALQNIAGDRILYPVFKANRRSYPVKFINPTAKTNGGLLLTVMTPYGSNATYTGIEPQKLDAASPALYKFTSWYPKPENITGELECYAQFAVLDSMWYTIGISDISDCRDHNGNIYDGYELDDNTNTMSITKCNNKFNAAVRVPQTLDFASGSYDVVKVGGFDEHNNMELISFPETTKELLPRCCYNCYSLFEINLPKNLQVLGRQALQRCNRLKTILIPKTVTSIGDAALADCENLTSIVVEDGNTRYRVINDCLVDTSKGMLLQGLSTGEIPTDGSIKSLAQHCFSNTKITRVVIPEGITAIASNAFSRCNELTEVTLPDFSLEVLDATCFAWCTNITDIKLPEGLREIYTYALNSCSLKDVVIPSTTYKVLARSFGSIPTLETVTFKKSVDANGNIVVPDIYDEAFLDSGSDEKPVIFRLPWSAEQDAAATNGHAPWGARNAEVIFDYDEEVNNV